MTGLEHQIDFIAMLLKVLATLMGIIGTGFCWWASNISKDVKELRIQKLDCNAQYANKAENADSHHRIWNKLDTHDKDISALKADVSPLKSQR